MSRSKGLVWLAGLTLGLGGIAQAQVSTDEVRATVAETMADAETRASLLSGGDAGHDGKFFIAGDGFRLNVGGMIQFRYLLDFRDDENDDDFSNGFQNTRTKVAFNGRLNNDWDFAVNGNFGEAAPGEAGSGDFGLEDAWGRYNFANGLKFRFGQFKLPLLREELVSDARQLAAERSVTNYAFSQQWSQGIELGWEGESLRWSVAFSDGLNSANTDFVGDGESTGLFLVSGEAEYAGTGRVEFLASGNWRQFEDFTSEKGQDFGFLIGAAGHYQQSEQTPDPTDVDRNLIQGTVDVSLEGDSWNLYGAFIYRWSEIKALTTDSIDTHNLGFVVQGGWRFAENTEVFGRWDGILADDERPAFNDEDFFSFITVGINQYYAGHAAKATIDAVFALEDDAQPLISEGILPNNAVGLLGDTESNEVLVRLQFQLLF